MESEAKADDGEIHITEAEEEHREKGDVRDVLVEALLDIRPSQYSNK